MEEEWDAARILNEQREDTALYCRIALPATSSLLTNQATTKDDVGHLGFAFESAKRNRGGNTGDAAQQVMAGHH